MLENNAVTGSATTGPVLLKVCTKCNKAQPLTAFSPKKRKTIISTYSRCKECRRAAARKANLTPEQYAKRSADHLKWRIKRKQLIIDAYGGRCACCGDTHYEFLSLDHIDGSGAEHKRRVGRSAIYNDIRKRGYPKDNFRLLCVNCNFALGLYGYCPHQKEYEQKKAS